MIQESSFAEYSALVVGENFAHLSILLALSKPAPLLGSRDYENSRVMSLQACQKTSIDEESIWTFGVDNKCLAQIF